MIDVSRVLVKDQYLDCWFEIEGNVFRINLKSIIIRELEVVVGMDWLITNKVCIIVMKNHLLLSLQTSQK